MIKCECKTVKGYEMHNAFTYEEYVKKYNNMLQLGLSSDELIRFITFDIETSTYREIEPPISFVYHMQLCTGEDVIFIYTMKELLSLLDIITKGRKTKIVCYVHNLSYEFQYMKNYFDFTSIFATEKRKILKCETRQVEFRCSYQLTNMSLAKAIENTPGHYYIKAKNDLDYEVLRYPYDKLTPKEEGYCYNDVKGLYDVISDKLNTDTLDSIPLTNTGYVRRDVRNALRKNKKNRKDFLKGAFNIDEYRLMQEGFRGGNTASNRYYTDEILEDVSSYDIASSYPYVIMSKKYPKGKAMHATINTIDELEDYNKQYCTLGRYTFINISLKDIREPIPYISSSKCNKLEYRNALIYNGRVLESPYINITLTNIDYDIIKNMYKYDDFYVDDFIFWRKDFLPYEMRECLMRYYYDKSTLKGVEGKEYEYMKAKNRLNSFFGMTVTSVIHDDYVMNDSSKIINKEEKSENEKIEEIEKFFMNRNNCLLYQWGIFVTAYARKQLQIGIDAIGYDVIYCDTDSIKYINKHDEDFKKINAAIEKELKQLDIVPIVEYKSKKYIMGIYDKEKGYNQFKTLGAKKYAYIQDNRYGITVSGLNKIKGAKELERKGGLKAFKNYEVFHDSGRSSSLFIDNEEVNHIYINNHDIEYGSYVVITDVTYTLGLTLTNLEIIENSKKLLKKL